MFSKSVIIELFLTRNMDVQRQPFRGVLSKRRSEKMQQIYRRTTMPKSHFGKGVLL